MEYGNEKEVYQMLFLEVGNIADEATLKKKKIDTIVNATNPTLMRSGHEQGVNKSIHDAIDKLEGKENAFEHIIRGETGLDMRRKEIRCGRGHARLTSGGKLCRNVIHVVGAEYDGTSAKKENCSSSRVRILASCYEEIINILKQHPDIRRIAIPFIGAGNYGFPFQLAAQIAIASVANALTDWREQDPEMFALAGIERIYFFIYDSGGCNQNMYKNCVQGILRKYRRTIQDGQKVVFQSSQKAHLRYIREILRYDKSRGYFSVARGFRLLLMLMRLAFLPAMWVKDWIGGCNWQKRRQTVERLALGKMAFPLLGWLILTGYTDTNKSTLEFLLVLCTIYFMCDTLSYLLTLLIMADIQNPSANLIRSLIMLLVNYMETAFDSALLYWISYREKFPFHEALLYGVLGQELGPEQKTDLNIVANSAVDYVWPYLSAGLQFFFASLVFGYLANHMRQRKFRS